MTTLAVVNAVRTGVGVELTGVAASAGGDAFPNTGKELLFIINAEAAPKTVTVHSQVKADEDLAVADAVFICPASKTTILGPFPPGVHNDPNGLTQVTYSGVTTTTVKVVAVSPA